MADDFARQVSGIGALAEPARRELYRYVVAQSEPVGRDQAAAGTGIPRHVVKFHLDKLVDEGLLETEYRRLSGKQGPGAGRPAKLYRRAARDISVSLPERHYELAGQVLAAAVEEAAGTGRPVLTAVARAAASAGRQIGTQTRAATELASTTSSMTAIAEVLASHGYQPRVQPARLVLANCPFHALAKQHTELVCGMNLELIAALTDELGHTEVEVHLDPAPDRCCVTLQWNAPTG